ncbi:hypothetical protein [Helicobacter canis]|uniref:Tellurite resistance TerB family protein n=1 Tax=Helicobacter canis TaxID=29419 RepID=A0A377J3T2_9HELI|nr:hypothetical protein [Helicobacter canis]STO97131.1 tellurite resistance TerB family protein [Helicobacter canis]
MSILLLILAGVVVYYLYITLQDYLKNPLQSPTQEPKPSSPYPLESTPYTAQDPAQKLQDSYEGASITLLAYILQAGVRKQAKPTSKQDSSPLESTFTPLQIGLVEEFIRSLSLHATKPEYEQNLRDLLTHYAPAYLSHTPPLSTPKTRSSLDFSTLEQPSIAHLAEIFLDHTYGEYKKRLQFVGFILMLAWSDKDLNHDEQDIILDIAAFLEIDNTDFNALYESFETLESSSDEALKAAKTLEQVLSEQKEQDQASLQQVFFTHIQKLCANARKKDKPQAELLPTLWACEQAYTDILQQLESGSKSRTPKVSKPPKSGDKVDSSLESTFAPKSSSQHSVDSTDSADSTPQNTKKRDSSWDNI